MQRLRIVYWVTVSLAIFLVHDPRFLGAVLVLHLAMVPLTRVPWTRLGGILWRLRFFLLFLVVVQGVFPPKSHYLLAWLADHLPDLCRRLAGEAALNRPGRPDWIFGITTGFYQALQVFGMVLVTTIVRASGGERGFLDGLRAFFLPAATIKIINACLSQLEANKEVGSRSRQAQRDSQERKGPGTDSRPRLHPIRSLLRGDAGWVLDKLEGPLSGDVTDSPTSPSPDESDNESDELRDVRLMTRISLVLVSLRMLKITPGTGLAPGHQNLIVLPLLCLAAERTHRRWGATVVGTSAGLLSVMLGLGRNGIFILPAQMLPGVLVDIGWSVIRATGLRRWRCMILGVLAGFSRFAGMLLVLLLLGNPELLAAVPLLSLGHVCFGFLSGTVTYSLISQSRQRQKVKPQTGCMTV